MELAWFNRVLVPMMWLQRKLLLARTKDHGPRSEANLAVPIAPINAGLMGLLEVERRLIGGRELRRVPGSSLWFAMRRRAGEQLS